MFLLHLIGMLLRLLVQLVLAIAQIATAFILALAVGIVYIVRVVLPYVLRGACVAAFVFGWLQGVLGAHALYAQLTDSIGALFVASALGVCLIALPVRCLARRENIWSAFALAGIGGFASAFMCAQAQANYLLQWIARGLPVSLAASGLIYIAVTNKGRRRDAPESHRADSLALGENTSCADSITLGGVE